MVRLSEMVECKIKKIAIVINDKKLCMSIKNDDADNDLALPVPMIKCWGT